MNVLSNAVKVVTLGPKGRNVVLERPYGAPAVTKDGVCVAMEIKLKDKVLAASSASLKARPRKVVREAQFLVRVVR